LKLEEIEDRIDFRNLRSANGWRKKRSIIIFLCIAACLFGTLREEARANSQAYHISIAWLELAQSDDLFLSFAA